MCPFREIQTYFKKTEGSLKMYATKVEDEWSTYQSHLINLWLKRCKSLFRAIIRHVHSSSSFAYLPMIPSHWVIHFQHRNAAHKLVTAYLMYTRLEFFRSSTHLRRTALNNSSKSQRIAKKLCRMIHRFIILGSSPHTNIFIHIHFSSTHLYRQKISHSHEYNIGAIEEVLRNKCILNAVLQDETNDWWIYIYIYVAMFIVSSMRLFFVCFWIKHLPDIYTNHAHINRSFVHENLSILYIICHAHFGTWNIRGYWDVTLMYCEHFVYARTLAANWTGY